MFRGDSMKSLFIILIIFSLFISGCELIEEREPVFSMSDIHFMEANPDHEDFGWEPSGGGGSSGRGSDSISNPVLTSICENAFYGTCSNPSGLNIAEVHCSNNINLGCYGLCYVTIDSQVCGLYDSGLGHCYCENDGACDGAYGEPITSPDCQECTFGETQSCNLPQVPGTCGRCNSGLKTCADGQWSECEQVTNPITEICDNNLDDDCDCNADAIDADCVYSHLECNDITKQCVEKPGQGEDMCTIDLDCEISTHLECYNEECVEVEGEGTNQCSVNLDCQSYCGDNRVDSPNDQGTYEACDGNDMGEQFDCDMFDGFYGGELACDDDCLGWDTSSCISSSCEIDHLNWEGGVSSYGPLYRKIGAEIELQVYGDNNCLGKTVSFEVMEKDDAGDDHVDLEPADVVFVNNIGGGTVAKVNWVVEDQFDGIFGGNPEYYFRANVGTEDGANTRYLPLLYTKNNNPECGNEYSAYSCITDEQYPAISFFRDGDSTCEFYGKSCIAVEYSRHAQDGGAPEWVSSSIACDSPMYIRYPSDVYRAVCGNYGGHEYSTQGYLRDNGAAALTLVDHTCEQCSYDEPSLWNYDLENCEHGVTGMRLRSFDCDQQYGNCITLDLECSDGVGGHTYIGYETTSGYYTLARRDATIYAVAEDTPYNSPNTFLECDNDNVVIGARLRDFDCDRTSGTCVTLDLACGEGNGVEQFGLYKGYEHVPSVDYYSKNETRIVEVGQTQCGQGYANPLCADYQTYKYIRCDYGGKITGARFRSFDCDSQYPDRDCITLDVVCE
jgi:hypothetical protein